MRTYIALLRGINIGGHNILPMKELVTLLEALDLQDVKTYIQSGNVVFRSEEDDPALLSNKISAEIKQRYGFEPHVLLLELEELKETVEANPFPEAESEPKTLHVFFLAAEPANPDLEAITRLKRDSERYSLTGKRFYFFAPDGVGRSKLAANVERLLGVPATGRNWRTVCEIKKMAGESDV